MRLRDETPPPPPIPSAVQAQDEAVLLEWVAAPSQDLHAFHVYRSDDENGTYSWLGGKTVEEPPTLPVDLPAPYAPAAPCSCDAIPLVPHEGMNAGTFLDKNADPKHVYWYRITAVDKDGNENKPGDSVPYSTFTFKSSGPPTPLITSIQPLIDECGLRISWAPAYDPAQHMGFVIYRGPSAGGEFRQVGRMVTGGSWVDDTVNVNVNYWYRVQALDIDGRPSTLSPAVKGSYTE